MTETQQPVDERYAGMVAVPVPSNCVFYPDNIRNVYARRFDLSHINDLGTAKRSGDLPKFIRTVTSTCNVPVSLLTQDDFQALCFWHRVNSFPRKPLTLAWECTNDRHLQLANTVLEDDFPEDFILEVNDAKKLLLNRKVVQQSDLKQNTITRDRFDALGAFLLNPERHTKDFQFLPPTVGDMIEFAEMTSLQLRNSKLRNLSLTDENYSKVVDEILEMGQDSTYVEIASYLSRSHGASLTDRIAFLVENIKLQPSLFDTRFLDDVETFSELSDHSVEEVVSDHCRLRGCEHKVDNLEIVFDLFNFFPYVQ